MSIISSQTQRPSTSIHTRLSPILHSPSFSKAGRSMRRLMHSAPSSQDKRASKDTSDAMGLDIIASGRNESLMADVNEKGWVEREEVPDTRKTTSAAFIESQFQLYIPQRLGAALPDDTESGTHTTRRDDALISSPRSVDSGLGGADYDADFSSVKKKKTPNGTSQKLTQQELEANARRQAMFLERTEAGRMLLKEYQERMSAEKDGVHSRAGSATLVQFDNESGASKQSRHGSARRSAPTGGSFFFKYTGRKDPALKTDAPPTGRYNPRFDLVEKRVSTLSMKKAFNPRVTDAARAPVRGDQHSMLSPTASTLGGGSILGLTPRKSPKRRRSSVGSTLNINAMSVTSTPRQPAQQKGTTPKKSSSKKSTKKSSAKKKQSPAPPMTVGGALQGFSLQPGNADDDSMDNASVDTETRNKRKQMKRYQEQVSSWIQSRFQSPPAEGLSSMRSSTDQRPSRGGPVLHDLSYWPQSDATRFMSRSNAISDMKRETARGEGLKPQVYDLVYHPDHNVRYPRTTLGQHNMNGNCDRDAQMRTTRIGVQTSTGSRFKTDAAMDKYYDTDAALEKFAYKRDDAHMTIDKKIGREDPRQNYLLATQKQALNTKGTVLGGLEPDHLLSQRTNTIKKIEFSKQVGRKFNPGFVMHDLTYDPSLDAVSPNRDNIVPFEKETERDFNPGFVMHDLMYDVKVDMASNTLKAPAPVDMKRDTSRANNRNAMLSRTGAGSVNDVEYERAPEQQLSLQDRTKGNPFMRSQLGRSELERLSKRQRAAPDIFYPVQPAVFDKVQKREIRFSNVHMDKVTNRYEKFENSMSRHVLGGGASAQRSGGRAVEQPFVVRGQAGITLNDLSYNPKFDLVEGTPIVHKIC